MASSYQPMVNSSVSPQTTPRSCEAKFASALAIIRFVFFLGLSVTAIVAACFVVKHYADVHGEKKELNCYECIWFTGVAVNETDLPLEPRCMLSPKNYRTCHYGEVCAVVRKELAGMSRFHRSCAEGRKTGCVSDNNPVKTQYCFCNTDFCLS